MELTLALRRRFTAIRLLVRRHAIDAVFASLAAGVVYRLLLPYLNPAFESLRGKVYFWGDEGTVLYNAERIRQGEVLYRDFFDFQGLLGFLPFTVGFSVAPATPTTGRIVMYLLMAAWAAVTYLTVQQITRKRWAGLLVALYFPLCIFPTWPYAYQHFIADFWITCALLFAILAERGAYERGWLAAGVFGGIALWTSLSEGGPAFAAMLTTCILLRYAKRDRWAPLGRYLSGALAVTALLVAYLVATHSLSAAFDAIFVFPFTRYGASNQTEYGFDSERYVAAWSARGEFEGEVAQLLVDMTMKLPKLGVLVSVGVALLLLDRVAHRCYTRRVKHGPVPWDTLASCALAASVGSLALPVWAGLTRSDIAHIGSVQPLSVLALTVVWAPISRVSLRTWRWRTLLVLQALIGAIVVVDVLYPAGTFFAHNLRAAKHEDIDAVVARDAHCALIRARTGPDDRIVVNYGGFAYLTCERGSGIAFPHLFHDTYWKDMWPAAAAEIAERKPRILFLNGHDFSTLAGYAPELWSLYVGTGGDYVLAKPRPGPPFGPSEWSYTVYGPGGRFTRGDWRFLKKKDAPGYEAHFDDSDRGPAFTYVDDHKVQIFDSGATYVLELDDNGDAMKGTLFEGPNLRHVEATLQEETDGAP